MLLDVDRKKAAEVLIEAAKARKQATQLSQTWPGIDFDDAYAISTEVARQRMAKGARLIGYKVGLTSKAMRAASQIDEPDYGYLFDDMMIANGGQIAHADYCVPRAEVELALYWRSR